MTAFATIGGRPIGIVANQPLSLAGTLDIPASQKAARFVAFCDAFNLGLLTLVDTPGFYPGKDLEWRGMIRHGAQLVFAYARATVPRLCVILRKSYGGAYIVMDSKRMGNDLCFAWPWAELAVMGAGQAAAILQRRATPEERAAFEADYADPAAQPVRRGRARLHRRRHRPGRHPRRARRRVREPVGQARAPAAPQARQRAVLRTSLIVVAAIGGVAGDSGVHRAGDTAARRARSRRITATLRPGCARRRVRTAPTTATG